MSMTGLRCSVCKTFRISSKRNFMEGFQIVKNKPICKECLKKREKK